MRRVSGPSWAGPWDPEACEARTLSGPGPRPSGGSRGRASRGSRWFRLPDGAPAAELPKLAESPGKRPDGSSCHRDGARRCPLVPPARPGSGCCCWSRGLPGGATSAGRGWLQLRLRSRRAALRPMVSPSLEHVGCSRSLGRCSLAWGLATQSTGGLVCVWSAAGHPRPRLAHLPGPSWALRSGSPWARAAWWMDG